MWLSRRAGFGNVHRVTGIDLAEAILSMSERQKWRLFFLGASPANLEQAITRLQGRFDSLDIVGCHHGYFKQDGIERIIATINGAKPDILFLGLGMPQKEYFIRDHFAKMAVKFCLPVGGAFERAEH
jgi:N-acetylglucosaminyldiphosphoundecaprenol N-acetyl-beta-D-mannosaminyltransferase